MSLNDEVEHGLRSFAAALTEATSDWALIGGLAVSARATPRFTRDVDIAVAVGDDAGAEAITFAMARHGWPPAGMVEQYGVGRLAQVRFSAGPGQVMCDLMFTSSGIEVEVVESAETLEIVPGLRLPVARTGHLVAMKLLSVDEARPQDQLDLNALCAAAGPGDEELARSSVALITERGFHRERDLSTLCAALPWPS